MSVTGRCLTISGFVSVFFLRGWQGCPVHCSTRPVRAREWSVCLSSLPSAQYGYPRPLSTTSTPPQLIHTLSTRLPRPRARHTQQAPMTLASGLVLNMFRSLTNWLEFVASPPAAPREFAARSSTCKPKKVLLFFFYVMCRPFFIFPTKYCTSYKKRKQINYSIFTQNELYVFMWERERKKIGQKKGSDFQSQFTLRFKIPKSTYTSQCFSLNTRPHSGRAGFSAGPCGSLHMLEVTPCTQH